MHVLIANTLYHPHRFGGAETSVRVLAEALVAGGACVTVVSTSQINRKSCEINGVESHYITLRNFFWPFDNQARTSLQKGLFKIRDIHNTKMLDKLDALLSKTKPDILHTNNITGFSAGIWGVARRRGLPIVHTLRDYSLLCPMTTMYKRGANCSRQCLGCAAFSSPKRRQSRNVATVVGLSSAVLQRHLDSGYFRHAGRRYVVHNGYAPRPSPHRNRATAPLRFGYLGRLTAEKGVEVLCQAFSSIGNDQIRLLVAGTGEDSYLNELRQRFGPSSITFLGFQEPDAFLAEIDVLVVPSLWAEPLTRVVCEAYGHGVPVIAADRGGLPEVVDHGRTGLLYRAEDVADLQTAIRRFFEEPGLIHALRSNVLKKAQAFLPEVVARSYATVYREALQDQHTASGGLASSPLKRA